MPTAASCSRSRRGWSRRLRADVAGGPELTSWHYCTGGGPLRDARRVRAPGCHVAGRPTDETERVQPDSAVGWCGTACREGELAAKLEEPRRFIAVESALVRRNGNVLPGVAGTRDAAADNHLDVVSTHEAPRERGGGTWGRLRQRDRRDRRVHRREAPTVEVGPRAPWGSGGVADDRFGRTRGRFATTRGPAQPITGGDRGQSRCCNLRRNRSVVGSHRVRRDAFK